MKLGLLIIIIAIFCSCDASRKGMQNYYFVEPFKEQEVNLYLKDDSTFIFQDLTGCNQFEFTGRYKQVNDSTISYLIFNSVKPQNVLPNSSSDLIFSVQDGDTAWLINRERIFIHRQPFIATSKSKINLQKIRYKKLKAYYTSLLGKEGFLKVFGDGSKKKAKKRLLECKLPDINIR